MCDTTAVVWITAELLEDQLLNLPATARSPFMDAVKKIPDVYYCIRCQCWGVYTLESALLFTHLAKIIGIDLVWNDGLSAMELVGIHTL